jgi:polyhydroxyalkanoate synthesis regulator phasin
MSRNVIPIDFLSPEQIKKRMENYERVEENNFHKLYRGQKIKYFEFIQNENKFRYRPGGSLVANKSPDYIVLTNGKQNWSVQLEKSIIFKERNISEIISKYEDLIVLRDGEIMKLNENNLELKKQINILKNKLRVQQDTSDNMQKLKKR